MLTFDSPPLNLFDQRMIDDLAGGAVADGRGRRRRGRCCSAPRAAPSPAASTSHVFDGLTPEQGERALGRAARRRRRVEALPLPVVFAAHALTLTAAFEIALGCDLIVAARWPSSAWSRKWSG